jgi:TonB family protein
VRAAESPVKPAPITATSTKAAERPLTLAMVSDDLSVPKALQAGANSILRKPLLANQIKDTLTTARDLLRAKQESASNALAAAAGATGAGAAPASISTLPANLEQAKERNLRGGEFLVSAPPAPGGQFVIDSDVHEFRGSSSIEKDLEPVAASVESVEEEEKPAPPPETGEVRGLEWYLKTRAGIVPQASATAAAQASAQVSAPAAPPKPELLGYDQTPSFSSSSSLAPTASSPARFASAPSDDSEAAAALGENSNTPSISVKNDQQNQEQKKEAELFAYITRGSGESEESPRPRFRLRGAIIGALALASLAIAAAPQAPWHSSVQGAWAHGRQTIHAWLNPQLVTTPQAPISSLKSQMASSTPDAGGNRPVESAMPSIEPVVVAEGAERGLLSDQPAVPYPASAKGQQGTVVLQVLIGRDGTVQDAKFLQGSLAFARGAIDGVKQWKFKPYLMNGRPVSVQTLMTLSFKPAS